MVNRFILFCIYNALLATINKFTECTHYKAGVVEYYYDVESKLEPKIVLDKNVHKYVNLVEKFNKTQPTIQDGILVFPECGLTCKLNTSSVAVLVPEPDYMQYNFSGFEVIDPLSIAARKYHIWLVVNLVEKDGSKTYNTDVVFTSNGTIAAKYRKYNLFTDPVDKPPKPEIVSFTTDFKVTFGIFTCFDIMFSQPALDLVSKGIKHFIFPTAWYSELPFLTAVQYQKGWSWSNNVSLLAAGLSYSKLGNTGSGIYRGRNGHDLYYQTTNSSESQLIISVFDSDNEEFFENLNLNVSKKEITEKAQTKNQTGLKLMHEHLTEYSTSLIKPEGCKLSKDDLKVGKILNCTKDMAQNLTNRNFKCNFHVTAVFSVYICKDKTCKDAEQYRPTTTVEDDFSLSVHRLAAFNGVRSFYVTTGGVQTCAVISCADEKLSSCGLTPTNQHLYCFYYDTQKVCVLRRYIKQIRIGGQFNQNNTLVTPNILLRNNGNDSQFGQITNDFQMNNSNGYYTLIYNAPPENVLGTAAIWSRVFNRDGLHVTSSSSSLSFSIVIPITMVIIHLVHTTLKPYRFF